MNSEILFSHRDISDEEAELLESALFLIVER